MTDDERWELTQHADAAQRVWRSPGLVAMTIWWLLGLTHNVLNPTPETRSFVAPLVICGLFVVVGHLRALRSAQAGMRLARDARSGWVLRFTSGDKVGAEFLASSGFPWSLRGRPAPARLAGEIRRPPRRQP